MQQPPEDEPTASNADDAEQFTVEQFSTEQFSTEQFSTEQFSTEQFSTEQFSTEQFSTEQFSTEQFSTEQFSTEQFSTEQFSTEQFSTEQFSTEQFSTEQFSTEPSATNPNPLPGDHPDQSLNPYLVNWPEPIQSTPSRGQLSSANPLVHGELQVIPETGTDNLPSTPIPKPRFWTILLVCCASFASFMICSIVMLVVAVFAVHGEFNPRLIVDAEAMKAVSASRTGLLLLLVTPQLALLAPCLVAAYLSPVPIRKRLSMVRGHWPVWAWFAAAFATPLIGWISSLIIGSLMEESENLKMMSDIFRGHGESGFLIPLALLIGATPALCEELVFRGYIQTRLNRRFGPAIGIFLASAAFAVVHMDLIHIIAVFPLGVYLGVISWRSGSIFPAMLGHFVNNSISVFAVVLGPESMDETPTAEMALFLLFILSMGLVGAVLTGIAMWRWPVPTQTAAIPVPSAV